jgi:hypothetical protein
MLIKTQTHNMAQKISTGDKQIASTTTNSKGVTTTKVAPLVIVDGKFVVDTDQGVQQ